MRLDIGVAEFLGAGFEERNHLGLNIDRNHAPLGNQRRHPEGVVTRPRAHIGNDIIRLQIQSGNAATGGLLVFPSVTFQPIDSLVSHDLRNFPTHVKLADTIRGGTLDRVAETFLIGQATRASEQESACVKRIRKKTDDKKS